MPEGLRDSTELDFVVYESVPEAPPALMLGDIPLPLLSSIWFDGAANVSNVPSSSDEFPSGILPLIPVTEAVEILVTDPAMPMSVTVQRFAELDERSLPLGTPEMESISGRQVAAFVVPEGSDDRRMVVEVRGARAISITLRYAPFTANQDVEAFDEFPERTATWGFAVGA